MKSPAGTVRVFDVPVYSTPLTHSRAWLFERSIAATTWYQVPACGVTAALTLKPGVPPKVAPLI